MTHTTNPIRYEATYEARCDGMCHEANLAELADCVLCDSGTWELMCDECRYYAAKDCDPGSDPVVGLGSAAAGSAS